MSSRMGPLKHELKITAYNNMTVEWIPDSVSDCHVSTNFKYIPMNLQPDDGPLVFGFIMHRYKGLIRTVELSLSKKNYPHTDISLNISRVLFTPSGTTDLLSMVKFIAGWLGINKFKEQQCGWLKRGDLLLKFVRMRDRYHRMFSPVPVN